MTLHPAPGYVLAQPSPIDTQEEQRESGLIIRREISEMESLERAIVMEVGEENQYIKSVIAEVLEPSCLIFYTVHSVLGDLVIVSINNIVAYDK